MHFDHYQGWVEINSMHEAGVVLSSGNRLIIAQTLVMANYNGSTLYLPAGSEIPEPDQGGRFTISGKVFTLTDSLKTRSSNRISDTGKNFLNAPYLWGGRSVMGIDCSGLIQLVFKIHGIGLRRDASQQALQGKVVAGLAEVSEGDLVFFKDKKEIVSHVGIYAGNGIILHASKMVRMDQVDEKGIFNSDLNLYTHAYHSIRRIEPAK
jgi:hypothetical protein